MPTAKEIVDKYVTAIGGREAEEKFKTRQIKMDRRNFADGHQRRG